MVELILTLDQYEFPRYDFGNTINFKLYKRTGFTPLNVTAFSVSSYDTVNVNVFDRINMSTGILIINETPGKGFEPLHACT